MGQQLRKVVKRKAGKRRLKRRKQAANRAKSKSSTAAKHAAG